MRLFFLSSSVAAFTLFAASCGESLAASPTSIEVVTPSGESIRPLQEKSGVRATTLLFVTPDCPIANVYAPEMNRLQGEYAPRGVEFFLVYADPDVTAEDVLDHVADFDHSIPALLDPDQTLARLVDARVTPEAAVFTPDGKLAYRGRIDDLYVDFGKRRDSAEEKSLRLALDAVLEGREPSPARTQAVGCFIPDREDV